MEVFKEDHEISTEPTLDYETERGKPMPSLLHSRYQQRIGTYLSIHHANQYEVFPELSLGTPGEKSVPDLAIYEIEEGPLNLDLDEIKRKNPPLATIEILSPSQNLQTLVDKTNTYFSFGVKSCWIVVPAFQTITVYKAPFNKEVFTEGEILRDPNLGIEIPMDLIFSRNPKFKV